MNSMIFSRRIGNAKRGSGEGGYSNPGKVFLNLHPKLANYVDFGNRFGSQFEGI